MSELIQQIEGILQLKLHQAPKRDGDLLASVMPFKENYPKYALNEEGHVIGMNLARIGLTDKKWQGIYGRNWTGQLERRRAGLPRRLSLL